MYAVTVWKFPGTAIKIKWRKTYGMIDRLKYMAALYIAMKNKYAYTLFETDEGYP